MNSASHHIGPDSAPDRYRLLNSIGRGGEAVLYRAEIELDGAPETVVVKVMDSRTTVTVEQFQRLSTKWQEQAELLRFVNRPGVVGVREHFEGPPIHGRGASSTAAGRSLVLVMNHVEGLDLRDWREERTLGSHAERREVLRTLEQLADVLDWLHSGRATPSGRTVVHGDLSPGNVMVDVHGQATLVDFGLSKLTADHRTAEVWFTPGYAAPEVFEGKRTPYTDRYAFGAIAYFLLSGQSPPSTPEQLRAALSALPQVAAAAPDRVERLLRICAAEPDRRPENLTSWVKDVRSAVVSTTVTGASAAAPVHDAVPGTRAADTARDAVPAAPGTEAPGTETAGTEAPDTGPAGAGTPGTEAPGTGTAGSAAPSRAVPGAGMPAVPPPPSLPPTVPGADAAPAFPPPITASATPGVAPPTTVRSGPATAPPTAPATAPGQRPDVSREPSVPDPPRPAGTPGKKKGKRSAVALTVAAVLVAAALGAGGAWALLHENGDGSRTDHAADTSSRTPTPPDSGTDSDTPEPDSGGTDGGDGDPSAAPSTPGTVADAREVSLTTLSPIAEPDYFEVGSATINAQQHPEAYVASPDCGEAPYMEFGLGRAWRTFDLTAGIDDGSYYESGRLTIKVDDTTLWVGKLVLGKPQKLSLKVENGLRLRIAVDEDCDGAKIALGTPLLKR
ncbi:protein kinase [Streptomyces sp. NPDC052095]|uniref:protein kinase domain-containing protein n=1 Tax=unclassified Streptomyces TaxID=2593676 RepID=UPI00344B4496